MSARLSRWIDCLAPATALVAGVLVCLARSPVAILHPELYAEDGHIWFADAYNRGWVAALGLPHTGYLQSFPRLVAAAGLTVPLARLPLLFMLFALIVQVLPAAVIVSRRFDELVPSRALRWLLAAIYLALPNAREVNVNLTNAQWHLALLALLAVLARPAGRWWMAADIAAVALSGATGPFVIALLPIAAVMYALRRRRSTLVLLAVDAALAALQLGELASSSRGHYAPLGVSAHRLVEILGSEIVGGTFLGQSTQYAALTGNHELVVSVVLLVVGALLVGVALAWGPPELRLFNAYAALVLAASLVDPVASVSKLQWQALAFDPQMRYWFFPSIALLVDALFLASRIRPRKFALAGGVLLVVAAAFAMREDWRFRTLPRVDWTAEVQAFANEPSGSTYVFAIAPAGWTMRLVKH